MIEAKVSGIPDLRAQLRGIVPKLRVRVLRNALAAGARLVQREARSKTPVINPASAPVRKGYRKPGTVRDAISVRTSKAARARGDVGVFVNVRPAKGARFKTVRRSIVGIKFKQRVQTAASQRGANSPNDPFYWRFIEFGTARGVRPFGFLQAGAKKLDEALAVFTQRIGPAIQKLNRRNAPAP